jgi:hypothetical protein
MPMRWATEFTPVSATPYNELRVQLPSSVEQLLTPSRYGGGAQLAEPSNNINFESDRQRQRLGKHENLAKGAN